MLEDCKKLLPRLRRNVKKKPLLLPLLLLLPRLRKEDKTKLLPRLPRKPPKKPPESRRWMTQCALKI
jgi:hypothetical protein